MLRRTAAFALVAASLGVTACGEGSSTVGGGTGQIQRAGEVEPAESEALYVDLSGLTYQVQVSRQLNPRDAEDSGYFANITAGQEELPKGEVWFGVFLRIENQGDEPLPSAEGIEIEDTQRNVFKPVESENTFAYAQETIPGGGFLPNPERLQAYAGTQGSLVLFKIPLSSLDNRPLVLTIESPTEAGKLIKIDLDV